MISERPQDLKDCKFLEEKKNLILYGNVGTGKTHLATAIGVEACKKGYNVKFFRTAALVNRLVEARKGSVVITTNLEFSRWVSIFYDEQMTAAMIDRLIHHSYLLIFDGQSYRVRQSLMRQLS